VLVDFRPVTSPYEVSAIGGEDLVRRFEASTAAATARGLVDKYGLGFAVRSVTELRLPAAGARSLEHARPVPEASAAGGGQQGGASASPSGPPR
jgi:hypothetical protein